MKLELLCAWRNLSKLVRFLVLYAGGVALLFFLLPMLAALIQPLYESVSGSVKLAAVAMFLLLVGAWQYRSRRQSIRQESR